MSTDPEATDGWMVVEDVRCYWCGFVCTVVIPVGAKGYECSACYVYDPDYAWPEPDAETKDYRTQYKKATGA